MGQETAKKRFSHMDINRSLGAPSLCFFLSLYMGVLDI